MRLNQLFLGFSFIFFSSILWAQTKTITGQVLGGDGQPQSDASVTVQGSPKVSYTDESGNFSVEAEPGQTIQIISLDDETASFTVGEQTFYSVTLHPAVSNATPTKETEIEEVVVTALGIRREKRALTYSTTEIKGDDINTVPTTNFANNLSGKAAGLQIKNSGNFGGSTNIQLRGTRSIIGNNQALIVVDGVPFSNSNINNIRQVNGGTGYDFGNAASDIEPNDVESVNILKGAAATALYGSLAANGAIMITTKKARKGQRLGIELNSTVSTGFVDKETFITYQKQYGQGYGAFYGPNQDSFFNVNNGNPEVPFTEDASYGAAFDPSLLVYHWDSWLDDPNGELKPWVAAKNGPIKFFKNPVSFVNSVSLTGSTDKSTYRLSYTNNNETGLLPNSSLNKNTLNGNFSYDFADNFTATAFFTYARQNTIGRNVTGYSGNILSGFRQWWPVNVDIERLKYAFEKTGTNYTWNWADGTNSAPAYWDNPYWSRYKNYETDNRNRLLTGVNLSYDVNKYINILGRVAIDKTDDKIRERITAGSNPTNFGIKYDPESAGYQLYTRNYMQQTYDLIATFQKDLSNNVNLRVLGGGSFWQYNTESFQGSTLGGLLVPGLYSVGNSVSPVAPVEAYLKKQKSGLYGQATLTLFNQLFLDGSYRYDQSTTLPKDNRGYGYFSGGLSWVFSYYLKGTPINYAKIRASYAEVGSDPETTDASIGYYYNNGSLFGVPYYGVSDGTTSKHTAFDFSRLKPERTKSWEAGLEMQFFNNRLGFDVAVYKTNTEDQFSLIQKSTSTFYYREFMNAGEVENKGIELALNLVPVKTKNFKWDINVNWAKNENKLKSLPNIKNQVLGSYQSGFTIGATVGQSLGVIIGNDYVYDDNGNKVIDGNEKLPDGKPNPNYGLYLQNENQVIGKTQPKWTGGITNRFTYKNLSLSFLIDIKHGGDVYSLDQAYGQETGLYPSTVGTSHLGKPIRNTIDDGGGIIFDGVKQNGTPNDIVIDVSASGTGFARNKRPHKAYVYNAGYIKLREVALSYAIPEKLFKESFVKSVTLSVIGSNLWIIQKYIPDADPEAGLGSGNLQGFQSGVMPTARTFSFNVKVKF
ncbi:MAG: SusC/RagA family TonB-linked outer membrane protein [Flavobacteriaceae bacterium]|jgi:TonB-linked SusC/RagA family outer membrane protein|nr:SusC/RagA family TonB-linked outer membrane protein [Flavobacteriaceae bacterium]